MPIDIRTDVARYYDCSPEIVNDIPFYVGLIPSPGASILELGCGTGRVTVALVPHCGYIHGLDVSEAMLEICREKIRKARLEPWRAHVEHGNITNFDLKRPFDLIIAPFRVMQNLETDAEVDGFLRSIRRHLDADGTCILNVFRPSLEPEALRAHWATGEEKQRWEVPFEGNRLVCFDRRARMDPDKLILYPELIYRRYDGDKMVEESVLKLVMRAYYPDTFEQLIVGHGFEIINRWGGYDGESYGEGPELVVQFKVRS